MPIYKVRCGICESEGDVHRSFARYDDLPECCGQKMTRVICPPMVAGDIQPYISQIDGSEIASRSRHREHLRQHGCVEIGNEKVVPKPIAPPSGLKEALIHNVNAKLR